MAKSEVQGNKKEWIEQRKTEHPNLPVCESCGMVGSHRDHMFIAGWIEVTFRSIAGKRRYVVCNKCTSNTIVVKCEDGDIE